ncbi:ABC transporter permease [Gracilibacillus dipsosauri]|uniref:ABC transporter permease n=1 Tax=Gracilibacillus dipsosauri TaxID=178340 RepID=UPI00240A9147
MGYISYGIKAFLQQISYRTEVWLQVLGNFLLILIQVSIWKAVIGNDQVEGISLEQMITYSVINTLIATLLLTEVFKSVDNELKTGKIAIYLIKPVLYPLFLIAENIGRALYRFIFTAIPTMIICIFIFEVHTPFSFMHGFAFIIALFLGIIISFLIGYFIALVSFWFLTTFALDWSLGALMTVFSGSFFPLWFFPPTWRFFAEILPFQFLGFIPAAIYLGEIPKEQLFQTLFIGCSWTILLVIMVILLWKKAMKRLIIQGG